MKNLSITEASRAGISGLVAAAEQGHAVTLSRHGNVVAELVSAQEIDELRKDSESLRDVALVIARFATDSGVRTDLDQALEDFGLSRSELEAELQAELRTY